MNATKTSQGTSHAGQPMKAVYTAKAHTTGGRDSGVFAEDVSEEEASVMAAAQKPIAASAFGESTKSATWKTIPSWYVVTTLDHAVNPELQRFMAKRIKAETTEVKTSHVPFLSRPEEISNVIKTAAAQIQK
jgi:hypothetical protein